MIRTMKTATKISLFVTLMMLQKQSKGQGSDTTRYMMHIVFVQFDGTSSDEGINLKWATILETNLATYVIERSNGNEMFTEIGRITAKGSSSVSISYSFTDKNPKRGINVYRLKLVDTRGGYKESEYKQFIWTKTQLNEKGIRSYPNPSTSGNTIQIEVAVKGEVSIQLLNIKGARYDFRNKSVGVHGTLEYQIPSNLEKGIYILVVTNNANESFQTKVMIM
jgi:hypothetical protein